MATINDLERRIVMLERENRALRRDLAAARGIGVSAVQMRAKINAGGRQIEHVADPHSDHDAATMGGTLPFPTTPSPLNGHEEAFLLGLLV